MEKLQNRWKDVISLENLYSAFKEAACCKRYRSNVAEFYNDIELNIQNLHDELCNKTYKPLSPKKFYIHEPKLRLITAPQFRDRVVHHALVRIIEPYIDRRFISQSYACRTNKGLFKCLDKVQSYTRKAGEGFYFYSGDIHHYFPSINHELLKSFLERYIADSDILWLCCIIIDGETDGMPIGNLTSQLFANVYLGELDYYVKQTLHIKYYARYMDNFLIISNEKKVLQTQRRVVDWYVRRKLKLEPNKKSFMGKDRIPFCGGVVTRERIYLNKKSYRRAMRRLKKKNKMTVLTQDITYYREACISFCGYARNFYCAKIKDLEDICQMKK